MTAEEKSALVRCVLYGVILMLLYEMSAVYYASDRVERAQQHYIAEKIESYEDIEIAKALRILRWLRKQEGGAQNIDE